MKKVSISISSPSAVCVCVRNEGETENNNWITFIPSHSRIFKSKAYNKVFLLLFVHYIYSTAGMEAEWREGCQKKNTKLKSLFSAFLSSTSYFLLSHVLMSFLISCIPAPAFFPCSSCCNSLFFQILFRFCFLFVLFFGVLPFASKCHFSC